MPDYVDGTEFIRDIFRYGAVRRRMTVGYEQWHMMAESGRYLVDATEDEPTLRYIHPWGEFVLEKGQRPAGTEDVFLTDLRVNWGTPEMVQLRVEGVEE